MAAVAQLVASKSKQTTASKDELLDLIRTRSFKTGTFTLSSGKQSSLYFNMKPTMMWPRGAELAARELLGIAQGLGCEYVGGLEMGAVPLIGAMAALSSAEGHPLRTMFVRKNPKSHGTMDLIEGLGPDESLQGKHVLVIDDVATSGASILKAVRAARDAEAIVEHAACLVDRNEGADGFLEAQGVKLHSVFSADDFVAAKAPEPEWPPDQWRTQG
jgi:orotate phosphoribosyltransferase